MCNKHVCVVYQLVLRASPSEVLEHPGSAWQDLSLVPYAHSLPRLAAHDRHPLPNL